jgi:hypothetical protein
LTTALPASVLTPPSLAFARLAINCFSETISFLLYQ